MSDIKDIENDIININKNLNNIYRAYNNLYKKNIFLKNHIKLLESLNREILNNFENNFENNLPYFQ